MKTEVSSVQFSPVMSDSLRPHESRHARPPCPSPTPGVHLNSRPSSQWCHPAISSSVVRPLLLLPPIPPSIRVFSDESTLCMRWPKYWSFSFSIIPSKETPGYCQNGETTGAGLSGTSWGAASSLKGGLAFGKGSSEFADFNRVVTGSQYCLGYKCTWSFYFTRLGGLNNRNLSIALVLSHSVMSDSLWPQEL